MPCSSPKIARRRLEMAVRLGEVNSERLQVSLMRVLDCAWSTGLDSKSSPLGRRELGKHAPRRFPPKHHHSAPPGRAKRERNPHLPEKRAV